VTAIVLEGQKTAQQLRRNLLFGRFAEQ